MNARAMMMAVMLAATQLAGNAAAQSGDYLKSTENVAKIRTGQTTGNEVEALLGKSIRMTRNSRRGWDQWEYRVFSYGERSTLWISLSDDGVVREVLQLVEKRPGTT